MRLIALSIVVLAGAVMAVAGMITQAFADRGWRMEDWGCGVLVVGIIGVFFELYLWHLLYRPRGPNSTEQ